MCGWQLVSLGSKLWCWTSVHSYSLKFLFRFISICLNDAHLQAWRRYCLSWVSAALSPLLFLFISCLSRFFLIISHYKVHRGRRLIGSSGSLIWSKPLMELMFNPCGKFWWTPEAQLAKSTPHLVGAPGIFSDLLRSAQMLKREQGAENNGKLPHLLNP